MNLKTEQLIDVKEQNPQGFVGHYKKLNINVNGVPKGETKMGIKILEELTAENSLNLVKV